MMQGSDELSFELSDSDEEMKDEQGKELEAFKKSKKVNRSPPTTGIGTGTDANTSEKNTEDIQEETYSTPLGVGMRGLAGYFGKRKAEESPVEDNTLAALLTTLSGMCKMANELKGQVTQNTQDNIKKTSEALMTLSSTAEALSLEFKEHRHKRKTEIGKLNFEEGNEEDGVVGKQKEIKKEEPSICTRCKSMIRKSEKELEETQEKLESCEILSEVEKTELIKRNWPESIFKKTKVKKGNPFAASSGIVDNKLTLIMGKKDNSMLVSSAIARYPEIKLMIEDEEEEDDGSLYKTMENTVKLGKKTLTRKVFLVRNDDKTEVWEAIKKVISDNIGEEDHIGIVATEKHDWSSLRKHIEIEMRATKSEREIIFYLPTSQSANKTTKFSLPKRETVSTLQIILNETSKDQYDKTLRVLKSTINPQVAQEIGVEIKGVVKTDTGDMKITVEQLKEGSLENLQKRVQCIVSEVANSSIKSEQIWRGARRNGAIKTIFIRDLDTTVTKEELQEELKKISGISAEQMNIVTVRPNQRGSQQTARVEVEAEAADILIKSEYIRIGWCSSRVVECVNPPRCYRCQRYGHMANDCVASEEKSRDKCLNCNKTGHYARACSNKASCRDCGEEGHRSGSMGCPFFRRLVNDTRLENKMRLMSLDS